MKIQRKMDKEEFFRPPDNRNYTEKYRSTLHLLRRDLEELYGKEGDCEGLIKAPFLCALGIMSGIELLTKIYVGKAKTDRSDIIEFIKICGIKKAKAIYQFRCALSHGYGLNAVDRGGKKYRFQLTEEKCGDMMQEMEEGLYRISIIRLKEEFVRCIEYLKNNMKEIKFIAVPSPLRWIEIT